MKVSYAFSAGLKNKKIKCVVWDLDNTLWHGTLLEKDEIVLRQGVIDIIKAFDSRGIIQSIASKNDFDLTMKKLEEFKINEYFLYPQINWNSKSHSIKKISELLNIGIDTFAFIDDQKYELDEVNSSIPDVLCIDAQDLYKLLDMPEMIPDYITEDSRSRRIMYLNDIKRNKIEENFVGPQEEFLSSLNMVFTITYAKEDDLQRIKELTVRTHQLNTTGYTYSYDELYDLSKSERYKLLICELEDKFGTYGKIGFALVECSDDIWTLKLLLMSCRVISRGVGTVLLNHIMRMAASKNAILRAEFIPNDKNRMMYVTLKFAGLKEIEQGNRIILESELKDIQEVPEYITVRILD